jgi:hypothetical protein
VAQQNVCINLELNIMMNNTNMSWQCVYLPLKSYPIDVDDQAIA